MKLKTDEELANWMVGWKEHSANYILAEIEFKRRLNKNNEVRGWIAIVLSVTAIAISIIAFINHIPP